VQATKQDVTVINISGDLDLSTAPDVCARVEDTFRERGASVLLDLTELTFCDSTGLRALLGVVREAKVHGVPLRIQLPREAAPMRALELSGTLEFLPIA